MKRKYETPVYEEVSFGMFVLSGGSDIGGAGGGNGNDDNNEG
jgi:hypothetical protein